jgi:hypothetical protein
MSETFPLPFFWQGNILGYNLEKKPEIAVEQCIVRHYYTVLTSTGPNASEGYTS